MSISMRLIVLAAVIGLAAPIWAYACNPADAKHCWERHEDCLATIDNENDPGAADKRSECWQSYHQCMEVNDCG